MDQQSKGFSQIYLELLGELSPEEKENHLQLVQSTTQQSTTQQSITQEQKPSKEPSEEPTNQPEGFLQIYLELLNELPSEEKENHIKLVQQEQKPPSKPPQEPPTEPSSQPIYTLPIVPPSRKCTFCPKEATCICTNCHHQFCQNCKNHRDVRMCSYRNCRNPCPDGWDRCTYHGYRGVSYGPFGGVNYDGR